MNYPENNGKKQERMELYELNVDILWRDLSAYNQPMYQRLMELQK